MLCWRLEYLPFSPSNAKNISSHCLGLGTYWELDIFPLTNTTRTAAYLFLELAISIITRADFTYAAVAVNISARRAFVIKPTLKANAMVKVATRPSLTASFVAKYKLIIEPSKRIAATRMLIMAAVVEIDFSSNRPIQWRPPRQSSSYKTLVETWIGHGWGHVL